MNIGDTLAEARRQAGLTVTQVSQRTCIRETIIRGIEHDDYSACGGDFYARGHIRSIARAVGADPEPLIREYDTTHGAPHAISAADVFEPATPIKVKERRKPNWSAALILALAAVVAGGAYLLVSNSTAPKTPAAQSAGATSHQHHQGRPSATPTPTVSQVSHPRTYSHEVVIHLTARQDCWVDLTTKTGSTIFQGVIIAGTSKHWTEKRAVNLAIGNPGGISLTVNGKNRAGQLGSSNQPVTLSFGLGNKAQG